MDGPDDELAMGGAGSRRSSRASAASRHSLPSSAAMTPTATPMVRRSSSASSSGGGGAPPPANAFLHTNDRWSHAAASASSNSAYGDLPPHERVRAQAMAVLEKAGGDQDGMTPAYELRQTKSGGLTTTTTTTAEAIKEPFSFRRSASTTGTSVDQARSKRYLRGDDTEQPYSFRSSSLGSSVGSSSSTERARRRAPAALAGLDLKTAVPTRADSRKWTISDDDEDVLALDDEDDLVEVVDMENRIMGGSSPSRGARPSSDSSASAQSNWSSRYSANPYLSGGGGGSGMAATSRALELDKDQQRMAKSARNMFMTSTPNQNQLQPSTNIFGSGFTFRQSMTTGRDNDYNLKTVWSDNDPLTSNGNSLDPPPTAFSDYTNGISKARRRRRICVYTIVAVCAIAIIAGTSKGIQNRKSEDASVVGGAGAGGGTTFYVMADAPYGADEGTKLSRDLEALPGDADFVIHLGNIQDASTTLCSEYSYQAASAVLKKSQAPIFMLPGENDWNNCPDPDAAWENWSTHFMKFERNFLPPFTVLRQANEIENFSFLRDGVLIIGLHLVGGRVPDQDEWDELLRLNVQWVEENFKSIFQDEDYRAVVLLGNARPSAQQNGFFNEIVNTIRSMGKPTLYIHANPEGGRLSEFSEYRPFGEAGNLNAVQLEDGGRSPPLRISVGSGSRPFALG